MIMEPPRLMHTVFTRMMLAAILLLHGPMLYAQASPQVQDVLDNTKQDVSNLSQSVAPNTATEDSAQKSPPLSLAASSMLPRSTSLMFSDSDIAKLYTALRSYNNNDQFLAQVEWEESQASQVDKQKEEVKAPVFVLDSILYLNAQKWSVWINGTRFRRNQGTNDFRILQVSEDEVEILWQSFQLDEISPGWKSKLVSLEPHTNQHTPPEALTLDEVYLSDDLADDFVFTPAPEPEPTLDSLALESLKWDYSSEDQSILIDSNNQVVKIRLLLHQTFDSRAMQINEGKQMLQALPIENL